MKYLIFIFVFLGCNSDCFETEQILDDCPGRIIPVENRNTKKVVGVACYYVEMECTQIDFFQTDGDCSRYLASYEDCDGNLDIRYDVSSMDFIAEREVM